MSKFKVGDRVWWLGEEHTVFKVYASYYELKDCRGEMFECPFPDELEPVSDTTSPQLGESGKDVSETETNSEISLETMQARIVMLEAKNSELCQTLDRWQEQFRDERNQAKLHPNTVGYQKLKDERDALQAELYAQERRLQACEAQLTLQDEGPASLLDRLARQTKDLDYLTGRAQKAEQERDALRAKIDELTKELREATQPRLINQSWQLIYPTNQGFHGVAMQGNKMRPEEGHPDGIAYLRRDTFQRPDGSTYVEAVLEPVETEKT